MKKCAVIGSINMDMVLSVSRFPAAGETLTALRAMGMEEVDWFLEHLGGAFQLTLDELG